MAITRRGYWAKGFGYYDSASITVSIPAAAVAGDVLLLLLAAHTDNGGNDYTFSTPSGWTAVDSGSSTLGGIQRIYAYYRTMADGDSAWTVAGVGTPCSRTAQIIAYTGCKDSPSPIGNTADYGSGSNSTSHTAPSITTTADNSYAIWVYTSHRFALIGGTAPTGTTEVKRIYKTGNDANFEPSGICSFEELIPTASTITGTRTLTNPESNDWASLSIELLEGAQNRSFSDVEIGSVDVTFGIPVARVEDDLTTGEEALDDETYWPVITADLSPYDPEAGAETAIYVSNGAYTSATTDTPVSRGYDAIIANSPLEMERSVYSGGIIGGEASETVSELELMNERETISGTPRLDGWFNYYWSDRSAVLRAVGYTGAGRGTSISLADATLLGTLTTKSIGGSKDKVQIALGDLKRKLRRKVQTVRLAGTGDLEGTEELKGALAPLVFGQVKRIRPLRIDRANSIYLFHRDSLGSQCQSVDLAEIGGNTVSSDDYEVDLTNNTVTLNTALTEGKEFTLDVTGPSAAGSTVAAFMEFAAVSIGPLASADLSEQAFDLFAALYPGQAGWYLTDETTLADLFDSWLKPGWWWGTDRDGLLTVGQWSDPATDYVDYTLTADQIISLKRLSTPPPIQSLVGGYQKNWTPVREDGIVEAARGTQRGDYALQEYLKVTREDATIADQFADAETPSPYVLPLQDEADAQNEIDRLWDMYSSPWDVLEIETGPVAWRFDVGKVVEITWPRWDLSGGLAYRIATWRLSGRRTFLTVWRPALPSLLIDESSNFVVDQDGNYIRSA